jgi:hypothetical protein
LRSHSFLCLYQPFFAAAVILSFLPPHSYSCANGGKELGPPHRGVDPFLGDRKEATRACGRRSPAAKDESRPAGVEGAADQSPRAVATRGLRGELRCLPREGAWGAVKPIHAGHPALLRGGAPSPRPNSISQAAIFVAFCEGY